MSKLCSLQEAVATIKDGTSVAMGCALESLIPLPPAMRSSVSEKKI